MNKDSGKVTIHGKEYETVASRVHKFKDSSPDLCIVTDLLFHDDKRVVFKAAIRNQEGVEFATGHAEEDRSASTINKTSALENCETSAIGRALAAFGLGGTEFASADELANALNQQSNNSASDKQRALISQKLQQIGVTVEDQEGYLIETYGVTVPLSKEAASFVLDELIG